MGDLQRSITVWKGIALAVCIVIGSGLLGLPGLTLEIGNVYSSAVGWIVVIISLIPLIYIFAHLGFLFPSSAGLSRYAEEAVGSWGSHAVSFILCGTFTIGIPGIAIIGGSYIQKLFSLPEIWIFGLAAAILVLSTLINLLGMRVVNIINIASLSALIILVLVIIFSNLSFLIKGFGIFSETFSARAELNLNDIWKVAALLFWAFLGWENLSFSLGEFKNPEKNIPKVYYLSFIIVIFLYLGLAMTSFGAETSGLSVKGASGLTSLITRTPFGFLQMMVLVMVIPANASAWIYGASRLYYSSGQAGILPGFLGRLSKNKIPFNALALSLLVYISVLIVSRIFRIPLSNLVLIVSQNFLVLYVFSIFAYWRTEKKPQRWFVTICASISCVFLLSGFSWWIIYPLMLLLSGYIH
ncbi:MAG: amino acid permease, partial [Clostridia bacterium]|nr:amino acid permease [Clostridia bacterium]